MFIDGRDPHKIPFGPQEGRQTLSGPNVLKPQRGDMFIDHAIPKRLKAPEGRYVSA